MGKDAKGDADERALYPSASAVRMSSRLASVQLGSGVAPAYATAGGPGSATAGGGPALMVGAPGA